MDGILITTLVGGGILALAALVALLLLPQITRGAGKAMLAFGVLALLAGVGAVAPQVFAAAPSTSATSTGNSDERSAGFVDARRIDPTIEVDLRYASANNFTGEKVDGYERDDVVILHNDATAALLAVQQQLTEQGLGVFVFDAYRPTTAVTFFQDWSRTPDDSTKDEYYPTFEKPQLFELGYIADKSKLSLGGTVDLTVIDHSNSEPLDMGGAFDFFGVR